MQMLGDSQLPRSSAGGNIDVKLGAGVTRLRRGITPHFRILLKGKDLGCFVKSPHFPLGNTTLVAVFGRDQENGEAGRQLER